MNEAPHPDVDAGIVRYLKWLVTTLTVTMIVGLVVLIAVLVMRFNTGSTPAFPEVIVLPEGTKAQAVTRGSDWIGVVTTDNRFLIFNADGTALRQEIAISPSE